MYYVPEGTKKCGFYDCSNCNNRFLNESTAPKMICPYCYGIPDPEKMDMEVGPDEEMPERDQETATLLQVVEGEEEIVQMDALLSLAVTGGDYEWM